MDNEIKVTKCSECPMHEYEDEYGELSTCKKGAFKNKWFLQSIIHPNCPLKGKSITYKIGENVSTN